MRGKRVKALKKQLFKDYPILYKQYGPKLRSFKNLFKRIKRHYTLTKTVIRMTQKEYMSA